MRLRAVNQSGLERRSDRCHTWHRLDQPVLRSTDANVRGFEGRTLFKSHIIRDQEETLGEPFVMFYNADAISGGERIGCRFQGYGQLETVRPWLWWPIALVRPSGISGDPQIAKIGDLWVMFYFRAFWRPGAFIHLPVRMICCIGPDGTGRILRPL